MIMMTPEDVAAIHCANEAGGFEGALAEGRRRWPIFAEMVLASFVHRVLAMPAELPAQFAGKSEPRRDVPGITRKTKGT